MSQTGGHDKRKACLVQEGDSGSKLRGLKPSVAWYKALLPFFSMSRVWLWGGLIALLLWAVWKVLARQQDFSPLPFSPPSCLRMSQLEKWPCSDISTRKGRIYRGSRSRKRRPRRKVFSLLTVRGATWAEGGKELPPGGVSNEMIPTGTKGPPDRGSGLWVWNLLAHIRRVCDKSCKIPTLTHQNLESGSPWILQL